MVSQTVIVVVASLASCGACHVARADEARTEFQVGAAIEQPTRLEAFRIGPSASIELNPIEHWLQLEFGLTAFRSNGGTEVESDLMFKIPFDLSPSIELTAGLGPTWTHSPDPTGRRDSSGTELSFDFQFRSGRRTGWYIEPSYSVSHDRGADRSIGLGIGFLFTSR